MDSLILFLPGFSLKGKEESSMYLSRLQDLKQDVYRHEWRHWKTEELVQFKNRDSLDKDKSWNPDKEIEIIKSQVDIKRPISIVAKSIGTFVAAKMLPQLKVDNLVLMGIPINDLTDEELKVYKNLKLVRKFSVIANRNDSHGSVEQVKDLLREYEYELLTKESAEHAYPYVDDVVKLLEL